MGGGGGNERFLDDPKEEMKERRTGRGGEGE
jgi:hypothetical protein